MGNIFLGKKLKELRMKNGYTQQQIADFIGAKNKSTVASWESGKSEPDAASLIMLCNIYNVPSIREVASALGFTIPQNENPPVAVNTRTEELRTDEKEILANYNKLNEDGQEDAREHIEFLLTKQKYLRPEYIKSDNSKELA